MAQILEKVNAGMTARGRNDIENRFTTLLMVNENQPGVANEWLLQTATDYLDIYSSIEHKGWEHLYYSTAHKQQYKFSTAAADTLLNADAVNAKEKLWKVIQQTKFLPVETLQVIVTCLHEESIPFLLMALHADASICGVAHHEQVMKLLQQFDKEKYSERLWDYVQHKSKQVRQFMAQVLSEQEQAIEKSAALINHKSADTRQMAALILSLVPSPEARSVLQKAIGAEKNDDTRDIMLQAVSDDRYNEVSEEMLNGLIKDAAARGKLNKPLEEWLHESTLPPLYYNNGEALPVDAVRFLLYRMSRVKTMRSDVEARLLLNHIDKERSSDFALHLIKLFIEKGGKPEYKYLLALAALLGNDAVVDKIRTAINHWIDENRFKMAEYGVGALALQGGNKALRWVEWYSRKYRTKKANVGAAALSALEAAADELNITPYELGDRIVPDFGFDGLFKHFTIGDAAYRAFIDGNFKMAFFTDDNKKLKSLPAAAGNELKEEFKSIAKEVRDVVKSQSSRLEYYLVVQRQWTASQWQQFFLTNPIMFIYATKLLWGVYDANNTLTQCFYCQEDTTLCDVEDNEMELPQNANIGIVHPLHLQAAALQQWKQKFFDLSVDPVFPQLDRATQSLAPEDVGQTIIHRFNEQRIEPGSISGTLEKRGWRKGPTGDGGMIGFFFKEDYSGHIKAVLEVDGVFVAYFDAGMEARLGRLYFIDTTKENGKWIQFPSAGDDERLVSLQKIPDVFYSEVMADMRAIKVLSPQSGTSS